MPLGLAFLQGLRRSATFRAEDKQLLSNLYKAGHRTKKANNGEDLKSLVISRASDPEPTPSVMNTPQNDATISETVMNHDLSMVS